MNKDENKWLNAVRQKMENRTEPLPPHGWDDLERKLNTSSVIRPSYSIKQRLFRGAAIIAVLLATSVSLYYLNLNQKKSTSSQLAKRTLSLPMAIQHGSTTRTDDHLLTNKNQSINRKFAAETTKKNNSRILSDTKNPSIDKASSTIDLMAKNTSEPKEQSHETVSSTAGPATANRTSNFNKSKRRRSNNQFDLVSEQYEKIRKEKESDWSLLLAMGGSAGGSNKTDDTPSFPLLSDLMAITFRGTNPDMGLAARSKIPLKHHTPIRFGVMVDKRISRHFSLQTGLTYTLLQSEPIQEEAINSYIQTLQYIGIPLKLNYHMYNRNKVTIYWSNGAEVERCVSAKLDNKSFNLSNLQWSVNSAIGVQYKILPKIAVYAEPGISYFFNDGSQVETIHSEKPLNIDFHFGLKLTY